MALVETAFTVNVTPSEMPPVIHVSEYDIGRSYTVSIIGEDGNAFTIPTGTTATVEGTLNKKVGFSESATVSDNTVTFTLTESMTAQAGKAWCKIKLTLNDEPVQTCAFILAIDRAGVEADTVIGAPGFEEQIQNAVDAWIEDNPPDYGIDPTLSIAGEAADAKATGDAIAKVYEDIGVNEPTPTPETVVQPTGNVQGYVTQEGAFATATATKTFYFKGEPNTVYRMHVNDSVQDGVSQYIAEYPSIPSIGNVSTNYVRVNGREDVSITTGDTAGYICFGHGYEATNTNMTVYAQTQSVESKTLGERVADLETAVSEIDSGSAKTWNMELEFGSLNQSTVPNESKNLFTADNMTNGCDVSDSFTKFARTGFYYAAKKSISFNQNLIGCVYEYDADFAFIRVDLISSRTVELDENTRFVKVSVQPNATATSVTWSQGGFNGAATNRIVSNLIGASTFDFVLMKESDSMLLIEFYDSNNSKIGNANGIKGMFINKTMILDRFTATVSGKTVNDVAYVKLSAKNAANTDIDTTYAPFVGLCSNAKLPKITVTTYAEKDVFKNKGVYGSTIQCVIPVTANDGQIYCTSILLRLPMNYSHIGEPSKLIFFKTGSDGYTNIRVSEFNYKDYLMYWVDSGYAVADCYGCTSKYPDMNPFGMPTNLCAYSAMWDFVKTHYNIDVDGFYLSCKSLGGMSANLMLANRNLPIRAAALFAPALINTKVCFGYYKNQRLAFIDDAGLEGDLSYIEQDGRSIGSGLTVDYQNEAFKTIVKNNHDKLLGFLPLETGVANKTLAELLDIEINTSGSMDGVIRYMQTPTRIWVAPDDTDTPYIGIESFVKSAQNGHSPVTIRTMPSGTGGHHSVDTASNAPKTNVTTRLGVTYSNFPIAYVEALQFLERY